jgi:hypothetical protein
VAIERVVTKQELINKGLLPRRSTAAVVPKVLINWMTPMIAAATFALSDEPACRIFEMY